eukprot:792651-Alexandrium_andersonii.AAC.1
MSLPWPASTPPVAQTHVHTHTPRTFLEGSGTDHDDWTLCASLKAQAHTPRTLDLGTTTLTANTCTSQ